MENDPFDLHEKWNLDPPFYVRKVDAKNHWGSSNDDPATRVQTILEKVFVPDEHKRISIYLIRNRDDLRRVVVGFNARRGNPEQSVRYVAISRDELKHFILDPNPGITPCRGANAVHRDIVVDKNKTLRDMVEKMLSAGRQDRNFSKSALKIGRTKASDEFCNALDASWACACDRHILRRIVYGVKKLCRKRNAPKLEVE